MSGILSHPNPKYSTHLSLFLRASLSNFQSLVPLRSVVFCFYLSGVCSPTLSAPLPKILHPTLFPIILFPITPFHIYFTLLLSLCQPSIFTSSLFIVHFFGFPPLNLFINFLLTFLFSYSTHILMFLCGFLCCLCRGACVEHSEPGYLLLSCCSLITCTWGTILQILILAGPKVMGQR